MAGNANSGFGSNSPVMQKYVSAKGGRVKTKKGLGAMPPEKAKEIQALGRLANKLKKEQNNGKDSIPSGNTGNN